MWSLFETEQLKGDTVRTCYRLLICVCLSSVFAANAAATTYTIDIGGPMDELFIGTGWYQAEGPYPQFGPIWHNTVCRWASQGARVQVPVFPGVDNRFELRAEVRGDADQKLICSLDGVKAAELPVRSDLLYAFDVPAATIGDRRWVEFRIETAVTYPAGNDTRDLRAAVDWIKVTADAPGRNYVPEMLGKISVDWGDVRADQTPSLWKYRYDPNNIGDTHAPRRFNQIDYDDSAWQRVGTTFVQPMRRGDAAWYRTWVNIVDDEAGVRRKLRLPGDEFETDGLREAWVNGIHIEHNHSQGALREAVAAALAKDYNLVIVKVMKGPFPRVTGTPIIERPPFAGSWSPQQVSMRPGVLMLQPACANTPKLSVELIAPSGKSVGSVSESVIDLGDGRRGIKLSASWPFSQFGEYAFVVRDEAGREQRFPVHYLGIHLFHWGWYSAADGTNWNGFKPCSNDYIDELLPRLDDWGRPHHSICWGGAILAPGTGFHRTAKVNYVNKWREAIAAGKLEFVGMPFPPRNICTEFGETALRSMRLSKQIYKTQLGIEPRRFYSHDADMTPQLPQLMALCGYDTYTIAENWWGQGRSVPNSRDGFFRAADGSQVRILDSWYHGVPPAVAASRAIQQGKPAVLCNEEFACLDRTTFLEKAALESLASQGIFLQPISLDEYQRVTEPFARELVYEGDDALCYKGWTGGGEGEFEFEKANRRLETQLVALENVVALARWFGIAVDQKPIDEKWDFSMRNHECHYHWGNGFPETTANLWKAAAWTRDEIARVAGEIATKVGSRKQSILVLNPAGLRRDGLVRLKADPGMKSMSDGTTSLPLQADPDQPSVVMALARDLPSIGYRRFELSTDAPSRHASVTAEQDGEAVVMDNGTLHVRILPNGVIEQLSRESEAPRVIGPMHDLRFARPKEKVPQSRISTADNPLNAEFYAGVRIAHEPKIVCTGPVMAAVECYVQPVDYPAAQLTMRFALTAHATQVDVTLTMTFAQPTNIVPEGGPAPHEGTYIPGIFVTFPMPANAKPLADMAYCTTDGVLTSTNHETFMSMPFRNGTFNTLSMAGPNNGDFAVLTRGLPDFFVLRKPQGTLGMSLGMGVFHDRYTHEYALYVPSSEQGEHAATQSYLAAQAFLAEAIAVKCPSGETSLHAEASLAGCTGKSTLVSGVQLLENELAIRVLNLENMNVASELTGLFAQQPMRGSVWPGGKPLDDASMSLAPKAIREVRVTVPVTH